MRVVPRDCEGELIAGALPHARVRGDHDLEEAEVVGVWEADCGHCAPV